MTTQGYQTTAVAVLSVVQNGRPTTHRAAIKNIANDGARITCDFPISVGSSARVLIEGYKMTGLTAQITANYGNSGAGYDLELRLIKCTWPYDVFTNLMTLAAQAEEVATSIPKCIKELGLTLPCSVKDVQSAFDRRVRTAHPDRGGSVDGFVKLRQAYQEALELLGAKR